MTKVLIAIPSLDMVPIDFAMSLAAMLSLRAHDPKLKRNVDIALTNQRGSMIWDARNHLVDTAQSCGASHILFLDSDMCFPPDTLSRLLYHHKPIVAASYVRRTPPHTVIGLKMDTMPINGLRQMATIPLGCALIQLAVFDKLPRPYFHYNKGATPDLDISEDTYFCNAARDAGFRILLDDELTKQIGHVGSRVYRPGDL